MKDLLNHLIEGGTLTDGQAKQALIQITTGDTPPAQIAAFLVALRQRPLLLDELEGFVEALRSLATVVNLDEFNPIDLCGTGGDGKDSFNISTVSAFVVAGAGVFVAKHGNHGVSSSCGSSTLLEALGVRFSAEESKLKRQIEEARICFLHAPFFHPALKSVALIRKELGLRTFFNLLGPLVNPASPRRQVIGVPSLEISRLFTYFHQRNNKDFLIVHSLDGYDEVSLTGPVKIAGRKSEQLLMPEDFGFDPIDPKEIVSSGVEDSQKIFNQILNGDVDSPRSKVVQANAAVALHCAESSRPLLECVEMARESISSGRAAKSFKIFLSCAS